MGLGRGGGGWELRRAEPALVPPPSLALRQSPRTDKVIQYNIVTGYTNARLYCQYIFIYHLDQPATILSLY